MKIPKPRRLPSGSWFIQLRIGGESVPVTAETEKKCVQAAQLIKAEYLAGKREVSRKSKKTLSEAIDDYITERENVLSPSTLRGYRTIQRTRFLDYMGKPVSSGINWQAAISAESTLCSAKTLHNAWMLISAVVTRETGARPDVTLPQIPKRDRPYLTPEQIDTFVQAVKGDAVEIPALLGLCSLRCSEILGLRWENVDLKKGIVRVRGAAVRGEDGALVFKDTNKNTSSVRTVPIMPQLVDALQVVSGYAPDDFVVNCSQQSIYTRVNTVCRKNGLPEIGVHGLRHSFASLAYHLGMPYKIAMEIGGWSDDSTMQKIYTHIAQDDVITGADMLTDFYNKNEKR